MAHLLISKVLLPLLQIYQVHTAELQATGTLHKMTGICTFGRAVHGSMLETYRVLLALPAAEVAQDILVVKAILEKLLRSDILAVQRLP